MQYHDELMKVFGQNVLTTVAGGRVEITIINSKFNASDHISKDLFLIPISVFRSPNIVFLNTILLESIFKID